MYEPPDALKLPFVALAFQPFDKKSLAKLPSSCSALLLSAIKYSSFKLSPDDLLLSLNHHPPALSVRFPSMNEGLNPVKQNGPSAFPFPV